jgi:hypothetical protein
MTVEARVARIVTSFEIAVTAGAEEGVGVGWNGTVWRDISVSDPDTNEPLGFVRRPIANVVVNEVQDRLCVAESVDEVETEGLILPRERIRFTKDRAAVDYRTVLVLDGSPVTLEPPSEQVLEATD